MTDFAKRIASLSPEKRALLEARLRRSGAAGAVPARAVGSPDVSFAQERIWKLAQGDLESEYFVVIARFRLPKASPLQTLRQALEIVIGRHEALRTSFVLQHDKPVQVVEDAPSDPLEIIDPELAGHDLDQATAAAVDAVRALTLPLFRALTVVEQGRGTELILVTHAIVCDGPSLALLRREILTTLAALEQGSAPELPAVSLQPVAYARQQRQRLRGARIDQLVSQWRSLEQAPALLGLHTDRPRQANLLPDMATFGWEIESVEIERIRAALNGSDPGVSLRTASLWATALAIVLSRFARQNSLVLGIQTLGVQTLGAQARTHPDDESAAMVGVATQTLPLFVDLGEDPHCRDLAAKVDDDLKSCLEQEELPYEKLIEELRIGHSSRHNPLVQAVLAVRSELEPEAVREGSPRTGWFVAGSVLFDVALAVDDTQARPRLELHFNRHLFEEDTIQALAGALDAILDGLAAVPEDAVSSLPLLGAQALSVEALVAKDRPLPASPAFAPTIHGLFERRAALNPERIGLRSEEAISYADLNARANRLARALRERGLERGQAVGVCMKRSPDLIVCFLAILKAGGVYLPLDPQYPPTRLAFMVADSNVALILQRNGVLAEVAHECETVLDLTELDVSGHSPENLDLDIASDQKAYVIYTSGSTGEPKGVLVQHFGVCHVADEQMRHFELTEDDQILQFSSPNFDVSIFEFIMAPRCGGTLHLAEVDELIPGPPLLRVLTEREISVLTIPPSTLAVQASNDLPALRVLIAAGETCGAELVSRWAAPGRRFFNAYGPTEVSIWSSVEECDSAERPPAIGPPLAHLWTRVVDEQLRPVPIGAPGELLIGGPSVSLGYLNRPELTAERFILAPSLGPPDARWYRTGDVVRLDSMGRLWHLGRADRQIKVRGFRVEPAEVEAHLLEIPGVSSAAVEVESDTLVAYYTAEEAPIEAQDIQNALARQLPQHMVPQRIVPLAAMPVGATGKMDRGALVNLSRQRWAGTSPPRNDTERTLVEIWKTVLNLDDVGIEVDFFTLGGHSLLAASVMSRASEALGRELPLRVLFRARTIADLAAAFNADPASAETVASETVSAETVGAELSAAKVPSP